MLGVGQGPPPSPAAEDWGSGKAVLEGDTQFPEPHVLGYLARVALDLGAPIDFSVSSWQGLDAAAAGPYFAAMPGWQPVIFGGLQAGRRQNQVEIVTHPLWNTNPAFFGPPHVRKDECSILSQTRGPRSSSASHQTARAGSSNSVARWRV